MSRILVPRKHARRSMGGGVANALTACIATRDRSSFVDVLSTEAVYSRNS